MIFSFGDSSEPNGWILSISLSRITLATIGYGDLTQPLGKLVTVIFVISGVI